MQIGEPSVDMIQVVASMLWLSNLFAEKSLGTSMIFHDFSLGKADWATPGLPVIGGSPICGSQPVHGIGLSYYDTHWSKGIGF